MRTHIIAAILALSVTSAFAQTAATPTATSPPAATASLEQRESWCEKYASWFVARVPEQQPRPADVRPTQQLENELNYCKLDPQEYERETIAELARVIHPS